MAEIDSSIYFRQRVPDIVGNYLQGLDDRKWIEDRNRKEKMRDAYSNAISERDGQVVYDPRKAVQNLAGSGFGQEAYKLQEQTKLAGQQARGRNLENYMKELDVTSKVLGNVNDPQSWEAGKKQLQSLGIDLGQYADTPYDPKLRDSILNRSLTAKDQLGMRLEREKMQSSMKLKDKELKAQTLSDEQKRKDAVKKDIVNLRKERSSLPTTRDTQKVSAAFNKIQKAAEKPDAAGDLSLIFNYMKMLDPGSTVREGEFANAQNAAGVDDRIVNMYNRVKSGQRLSDNQRKQFVGQSSKIYESQMDLQNQIDAQYAGYASELGVDPSKVILNFQANKLDDNMNITEKKSSSFGIDESNAAQPKVYKTNEINWVD